MRSKRSEQKSDKDTGYLWGKAGKKKAKKKAEPKGYQHWEREKK